jgi:D-3-phosphoglycerate dehydrogenase
MQVLVCDNLSTQGLEILRQEEGISLDLKTGMSLQELIAAVPSYDALIIRSSTKVTAEVINAAKKLKVIGRAGVGLDNVDVEAATKCGIVVMNAPGGNTITTAEHTVAMIMAISRKIPQANISMKNGEWEKKKFMGVEVFNKTLGVIGLGRIGIEVSRRMKSFGMRVIAYDPFISLEVAQKHGIEIVELPQLLASADYISLHTPLTKETLNLIDAGTISQMKKGVYIINCARGGIIDEKALHEALISGHVAGAALDVFEQEPPSEDNPLLNMEQVVCTPHLGASTKEAQEKVAIDIAKQIADFLKRGEVVNAVNMPNISQENFLKILPCISLIEKMSKLLSQLAAGRFEEFVLHYSGQMLEYNISLLTIAAIRALLSPILGENVNYVNSVLLAKERNINVVEIKRTETGDYSNLVCLELKTDKERHTIAGSLFSRKDVRIVELDGFHLEAIPTGYVLVITNQDTPGVIGNIGQTLGQANINIGRMHLGREKQGGRAISLVNVDSPVPPKVLGLLRNLPNIISVAQVRV